MIEAVLRVRESSHSWITQVTSKFPATIRILDCKPLAETEGVQHFFELDAPEEISDKIIDAIQKNDYIREVEVMRGKGGRLIGEVKTYKCTACRFIAASECYLTSCRSRQNGTIEWIVAGGEVMFRQLLDKLEKAQVMFEVISLSKLEDINILTTRQEIILQIALEKGFFEFPRKIGLRGLAKILEVSPSTLSEIMRRAGKSILVEHLGKTIRHYASLPSLD